MSEIGKSNGIHNFKISEEMFEHRSLKKVLSFALKSESRMISMFLFARTRARDNNVRHSNL